MTELDRIKTELVDNDINTIRAIREFILGKSTTQVIIKEKEQFAISKRSEMERVKLDSGKDLAEEVGYGYNESTYTG